MKTCEPLPGTQRSILFAGISAKIRLPWRVHAGPSVHLLNPPATFSAFVPGATIWSSAGSSFCTSCEYAGAAIAAAANKTKTPQRERVFMRSGLSNKSNAVKRQVHKDFSIGVQRALQFSHNNSHFGYLNSLGSHARIA